MLVSIQSMILTPDPVFNEPGYERIKGTEEGEVTRSNSAGTVDLQLFIGQKVHSASVESG